MNSLQPGWQSLNDSRREGVLAAGIAPEDFDRVLSQEGWPDWDRPLSARAAFLADAIILNWHRKGIDAALKDPSHPLAKVLDEPLYGPPQRSYLGGLVFLGALLGVPLLLGVVIALQNPPVGLAIVGIVLLIGALLWFIGGRMAPR